MARQFDDGSSQYLEIAQAVLLDYPVSMFCWFKSDDLLTAQTLVNISDTADDKDWIRVSLRGDQAGDFVQAQDYQHDTGLGQAYSSLAYSANTWQTAVAVFDTDTSRHVYLNGGNKGSEVVTTAGGLALTDVTSIGRLGRLNPLQYMSGGIAEAAIWNVSLTDAEAAVLATGIRPIYVRPANIVLYMPLWRDEDEDYVGGLSFTAGGGTTVTTHPPIIWSPPKPLGFPFVSVVPDDKLPDKIRIIRSDQIPIHQLQL